MPDREKSTSSKRRASDAQIAAGRANLAKGHQARSQRAKEGKDKPGPREKWAMLLSGQMSVRDMDDEELSRMQFRTRAGDFSGKKRTTIPSHIASAILNEKMRRAKETFLNAGIKAAERMEALLDDPDPKVQLAAAKFISEQNLGRAAQTVQVHVEEDRWGKITEDAIQVDNDLSSLD